MKIILMVEINGNDKETLEDVAKNIQGLINDFEEEDLQYNYDDADVVIDMKLYDDVDEVEI